MSGTGLYPHFWVYGYGSYEDWQRAGFPPVRSWDRYAGPIAMQGQSTKSNAPRCSCGSSGGWCSRCKIAMCDNCRHSH